MTKETCHQNLLFPYFFCLFGYYTYFCIIKNIGGLMMENKNVDHPIRSKEEILSWLNSARQRKEAWEKKVDAKFAERLRSKKAAAESGYYDLEWI